MYYQKKKKKTYLKHGARAARRVQQLFGQLGVSVVCAATSHLQYMASNSVYKQGYTTEVGLYTSVVKNLSQIFTLLPILFLNPSNVYFLLLSLYFLILSLL